MRTQGIVLKKIDIGEYDQLVFVYTKDQGKALLVAKSILKPGSLQANHLDVLNLVDFSIVSGKNNNIITSAYSLNSFSNLKASLKALSVAFYILEIFDKAVYLNDPDIKLWEFLNQSLEDLDCLAKENAPVNYFQDFLNSCQSNIVGVLGYYDNGEPNFILRRDFKLPLNIKCFF